MNTNYPVIIDDIRFEHPSSSIISGPSMFFFFFILIFLL